MSKVTFDLNYLRTWQKEFFKNAKRFNVLVVHRRAWKTTVSVDYILYKALQEKWYYGYIAPTYKQAKAIAWDMMTKRAKKIPKTVINQTELKIELFNGSVIKLFWADNPDSLRWLDLRWVVFDEYAQQPSNIYSEIIYPMIVVNKGWSIWIWTPKWQNAFYELYSKAVHDDDYHTVLLTADDTWILDEFQLAEARKEMSEDEFRQEFYCSWTAALKWAYYSWELARLYKEWRVKKAIYDKLLPVFTFWDLWISDYTSIIFAQFVWNEVRVIDSYQANWLSLIDHINYVKDKPYKYEWHYFPHDIQVRELWSGMSRLELVRRWLWNRCYAVKNIWLKDWIDALRHVFDKLWFDEDKTAELRNCLANYTQEWDDAKWMFKDRPRHDWSSHFADAMRYLAVQYKSLANRQSEWSSWLVVVDYGLDALLR